MYEKSCDESRPTVSDSPHAFLVQMFNIYCICKNDFYLKKNSDIINVRYTEGAIENEQPRETGNIGYLRHKTKTNKTKQNTTQYVLDTTISNLIQLA
jgi:hypothetical protein